MKVFLKAKNTQRAADEAAKPLQSYRDEELAKMRAIFFDPNSRYHTLRHEFVNKIKKSKQGISTDKAKAATVS